MLLRRIFSKKGRETVSPEAEDLQREAFQGHLEDLSLSLKDAHIKEVSSPDYIYRPSGDVGKMAREFVDLIEENRSLFHSHAGHKAKHRLRFDVYPEEGAIMAGVLAELLIKSVQDDGAHREVCKILHNSVVKDLLIDVGEGEPVHSYGVIKRCVASQRSLFEFSHEKEQEDPQYTIQDLQQLLQDAVLAA